ncbi:DUF6233 domain-containing protein [Streptomyces sp. NPDC001070]
MYELPPDPQRLRVIRLYLQMQIAAVDAKIQEAESGAAAGAGTGAETGADVPPQGRTRPRAPARAWRLQSVPETRGGAGRGVVHRDDCRVPGGGRLNRQEFEVALGMPDVTPCEICRPERERSS